MLVELTPKQNENLANIHWIVSDPKVGKAPLKIAFPANENLIKGIINNTSLIIPFSRFTRGRHENPIFGTGAGLEGHLRAYPQELALKILLELEDDAKRMIKNDIGSILLNRFLDDPTTVVNYRLFGALYSAFNITLAKVRAIRGMAHQGFRYEKDIKVKLNEEDVAQSKAYEARIYSSPPIVSMDLLNTEKGILTINQNVDLNHLKKTPGIDIEQDKKFPLLAQIGRVGHHVYRMVRSTL